MDRARALKIPSTGELGGFLMPNLLSPSTPSLLQGAQSSMLNRGRTTTPHYHVFVHRAPPKPKGDAGRDET
ncbi:hypothetical protein VE02_03639 [Pseudogymnoascus sp. 03VT05]|nr:hypothetical protein VE02_03639 [Pseudogymnoascus sp. 03VT05]